MIECVAVPNGESSAGIWHGNGEISKEQNNDGADIGCASKNGA